MFKLENFIFVLFVVLVILLNIQNGNEPKQDKVNLPETGMTVVNFIN